MVFLQSFRVIATFILCYYCGNYVECFVNTKCKLDTHRHHRKYDCHSFRLSLSDGSGDATQSRNGFQDPLETVKRKKGSTPTNKRIKLQQQQLQLQQVSPSITENVEIVENPEVIVANEIKNLSNEQMLMLEAAILQCLPSDIGRSFTVIADQYTIRGSVILLAVHIMVLIPVLKVLKMYTTVSVVPYLYVAPLLFLVPYVALWLWENNFIEVPLLTRKLFDFITFQKMNSMTKLKIEEANYCKIVGSSRSGTESDSVYTTPKELCYLRVLSRVNVNILKDEVIKIKRQRKSRMQPIPSVSAADSADGYMSIASILADEETFLSSPSAATWAKLGANPSTPVGGSDIFTAAKSIVNSIPGDKNVLLSELIKLRSNLQSLDDLTEGNDKPSIPGKQDLKKEGFLVDSLTDFISKKGKKN